MARTLCSFNYLRKSIKVQNVAKPAGRAVKEMRGEGFCVG